MGPEVGELAFLEQQAAPFVQEERDKHDFQLPGVDGVGGLGGDELLAGFIRKLAARGDPGNEAEYAGKDFAQAGNAVGFVNGLQLGQVPEILRLLEEDAANAFLNRRPVFILVGFPRSCAPAPCR